MDSGIPSISPVQSFCDCSTIQGDCKTDFPVPVPIPETLPPPKPLQKNGSITRNSVHFGHFQVPLPNLTPLSSILTSFDVLGP
jgi:hypothetical protein